MSHYSCPTCSGSTTVIETRLNRNGRLRRRRRCALNHRFSTIELPHEVSRRVTALILWLSKQDKICPDTASYANDQLKDILAGIPEETDEPQEEISDASGLDTAVCGASRADGEHSTPLGRALIEALTEAAEKTCQGEGTGSDLHQGREPPSPSQAAAS